MRCSVKGHACPNSRSPQTLQAAELGSLNSHTGTADLLLLALVRGVANGARAAAHACAQGHLVSSDDTCARRVPPRAGATCARAAALAPVAFPRSVAPRPVFADAFEELRRLWPDTFRMLRRESFVWLTWSAAVLCACYTAWRFGQVAAYAAGSGGKAPSPALWALVSCGLAASLGSLMLVHACASAAAAVRRGQPPSAAADPERGLAQPLLSECDELEDGETPAARRSSSSTAADARNARGSSRSSLWRLIALSAPDKFKAIGAFVFLVLAVICDVGIPNYKANALTAILEHHGAALVARARGEAAPGPLFGSAPGDAFTRAVLALALASAGAGLFGGLRGGLLSLCNYRLVKRLQQALYGRLIRKDIASLDELSTGKLLSRLTTDTGMVGDVLGLNLNVAFRSLLRLVLTVGYLAMLSVPLTCVALGSSLAFFVVTFFFSSYQRVASKAAQEATADSNHVAEQSLSLARTVRTFCAEAWEEARFNSVLASRLGVQERQSLAYMLYTIAFGILDNAQSVVLLVVGGRLYNAGAIDGAVLSKFVFYSGVISASIQSIADMVGDLFKALGASEEVFRLLDEPIAVLPDDDAPPCGDATCVPGGPGACAAVAFQGVHFAYPSRPSSLVLNGIDLRIAPGQQVALVGLSGSGKSTIIQLLLRFYDAQAGRITFNDHDITGVSLRWLRQMMGVVGQEPPLFSVSLRQNIAYADDSLSDEAVSAAAGLACATVRAFAAVLRFTLADAAWLRAVVHRGDAREVRHACRTQRGPAVGRCVANMAASRCSLDADTLRPQAKSSAWPSRAPSSATRRC
jgi:ABC-type multidrug transport system fused ATPase/permease subunit